MRRREFIALVGGAAASCVSIAAWAQQPVKVPTIGYLGGGGPVSQRAWVEAFVQRLRELGWFEGRTIAIEYRWGEGRSERYAEIAAEFVRLKVDVILAGGTEAAIAAKQATSAIPIIFPTAGDPLGSRLVTSLARPGGNATGLSNLGTDLAAKRLEILREVPPGAAPLGRHGQYRLLRRRDRERTDRRGSAHARARDHANAEFSARRISRRRSRGSRVAQTRSIRPATHW